jgi:ferredoxin/flavodoxin---NADP+ reductase
MTIPSGAAPQPAAEKFTAQHVISWHEWAPTLFSFRVSRDPAYHFVPGQFARMGQRKDDGSTVWRAFSVCSPPSADFLEFFAVVVPHGEFTSLLYARRVGAEILLERPAQGFLTADRLWRGDDPKDLWMLATGTGLGPYVSMLSDAEVWKHFERLVVVHSVRHEAELGYAAELKAWSEKPPFEGARLSYVPTVTREPETQLLKGRIPALIESGDLEKAAGVSFDSVRSRFMLCGNPEMVEQTRALLKSKGFTNDRRLVPGHIAVENYW